MSKEIPLFNQEKHEDQELGRLFNDYEAQYRGELQSIDAREFNSEEEKKLEQASLKLFVDQFVRPTKEVLQKQFESEEGAFQLGEVLSTHLSKFEQDGADTVELQKSLVRDLVMKMKHMPVGNWDISTSQTAKTGKNNCSGSAALLTTILEATSSKTGIRVSYANPYGHALVVARMNDGSVWYSDSRNGVFEDISQKSDYEEREGYSVFGLHEPTPETPFRYLPIMKDNWRLVVENYAGNMEELPHAAEGIFDEVLQNTASESELAKIQAEAKAALGQVGMKKEDAVKMRKVKDYLESALYGFRKDPDFGKESELWKQIHSGDEYLQVIGNRVISDDLFKQKLIEMKPDLREFLIGGGDEINTGDEDIDEAFRKYRDARQSARIILHKSDQDIEKEVDGLLEKLR